MSYRINPWQLSPAQCATLEALAESGCRKIVARKLFCSPRTIENRLSMIKSKMGVEHSMQAVLAWDRHARSADLTCSLVRVDSDMTINGRFVPAGSVYKLEAR